MKVLITGGLGNLGLWLTHYFLEQGHYVTVLGRSERVIISHPNYQFLRADITDLNSLKASINCYYDICIHTASFNEHFKDNYEEDALRINALGTEFLCQALMVYGVGKLAYLSTFHIYGISEGVVTEDSPINPVNDYGLTHFFAEKYIEKHAKINGLKYVIFRLTNSYGCPKDINSDKWYLVLNDLCRQAHDNKKIQLTSNGKALRDFIWMGDAAQIIEKISVHDEVINEVVNLSANSTYSIIDVAEYVQAAYLILFGERLAIEVNENDTFVARSLTVSNLKLIEFLPYNFDNHFQSEAINILKMLSNNK